MESEQGPDVSLQYVSIADSVCGFDQICTEIIGGGANIFCDLVIG